MKKRTPLLWIAAIVVVIGLVFGVPIAVKSQIETRLTVFLDQKVTIEQFSFNPFAGTVTVQGILVGESTSMEDAAINIDIWPLLGRHLHIQSFTLSRVIFPITFAGDRLTVADYLIPSGEEDGGESEESSWRISLDGLSLTDVQIALDYETSQQDLQIQSLQLGAFDTSSSEPTSIKTSLLVNGAGVNVDGSFAAASGAEMFSGKLKVDRLNLANLAEIIPVLNGENSGEMSGEMSGEVSLEQSLEIVNKSDGPGVGSKGTVQLENFSGFGAALGNLMWQGSVDFAASLVNASGDLTVSSLRTEVARIGSAKYSGTTLLDLSQAEVNVESDSTLTISDVQSQQYGALGAASWQGTVSVDSYATYQVDGSLALQALKPLGTGDVESILIERVSVENKQVAIQALRIDGANLLIERGESGQLSVLSRLPNFEDDGSGQASTAQSDANSNSNANANAESELAINIEALSIKNSRVEFVDLSVEPLVDMVLNKLEVNAENFSLTDMFRFDFVADHQIEPSVEAKLKAKGNISLSSQTGAFDIDLSNFELHEIAPYLGSGIRSGRLQLKTNVKMNKGRMVVANDIHIRNVKIDDRAAAGGGDQMSLATALFLLKDKNDVVELQVPIETNFDNFEVGISDILQTALLTAARTTAIAYAQYALQPYGSLLLARDLLGAVTRPKFEPVTFAAGSAELSNKAQSYVEKLSGLLVNKSELTVTVCGFASMTELESLQTLANQEPSAEQEPSANREPSAEQEPSANREPSAEQEPSAQGQTNDVASIKALALARSVTVREVLQAGGVKSERIYACTSTVESAGEGRVEIAL